MNLDIIARRIELFPGQPDPEPIRLRTLILLRWAAITGQLAAVCGGLLIGVRFPLVAVLTIIALAAVLNLLLMMRPNRRISALEVAWQLGFDLAQVAALSPYHFQRQFKACTKRCAKGGDSFLLRMQGNGRQRINNL